MSGIEGILNRLEKQRNLTFGVGLKAKGNDAQFPTNRGKDDWQPGTLQDTVCQFCYVLSTTGVFSRCDI